MQIFIHLLTKLTGVFLYFNICEVELAHIIATVTQIDDTCFRYPRGGVSKLDITSFNGIPIEAISCQWTKVLLEDLARILHNSFHLMGNLILALSLSTLTSI